MRWKQSESEPVAAFCKAKLSYLIRAKEHYYVQGDCPNCGKSKEEIKKAFEGKKESKPVKHNELLERLKKAGLPTRV